MDGEYHPQDWTKWYSKTQANKMSGKEKVKPSHSKQPSQNIKKAPPSQNINKAPPRAPEVYVGGFPQQLTPSGVKGNLPIPAEPFNEAAPSLKKIFNNDVKIYVTPDWFFFTRFREVFQKAKLPLDQSPGPDGADEVRHWLGGPDMKYWPQQLNFATWCATTGCGISREIFDDAHTTLNLPPQVISFFVFHV